MESRYQVDKFDLCLEILLIFYTDVIIAWISFTFSCLLLIYAIRSIIFATSAKKFVDQKQDSNEDAPDNKKFVRKYPSNNRRNNYEQLPFISVLVATYNESVVIARFLKSLSMQTYPADKYELIIVDDSNDDTFDKILKFSPGLPNLKAVHRNNREGWKGGALNVAIEMMNPRSSFAIVVDADNVLPRHAQEEFVLEFNRQPDMVVAIQGFPISKAYLDGLGDNISHEEGNWASRAIGLRLAKRNVVEFFAKQKLGLPIQITGSLFMIRADVLRSIRFRSDLCEDWYLTIDVYLGSSYGGIRAADNDCQYLNRNNNSFSMKPVIVFNHRLMCYCEATTKLEAYFKQRMRVSEGHTRAFRKKMMSILRCKQLSLIDKFEFTMMGCQYALFALVPIIVMLDISMMTSILANMKTSLSILFIIAMVSSTLSQGASLLLALASMALGIKVCSEIRKYKTKDIVSLLALNLFTIPALVIGSLKGLLNSKGAFYRTERNIILHAIQDSEA